MPRRPAQIRPVTSLGGMRQRVEANRAAQIKLRREIAALKEGAAKAEAQRHLGALQTELIALNVEMHMRTGQLAGNA